MHSCLELGWLDQLYVFWRGVALVAFWLVLAFLFVTILISLAHGFRLATRDREQPSYLSGLSDADIQRLYDDIKNGRDPKPEPEESKRSDPRS